NRRARAKRPAELYPPSFPRKRKRRSSHAQALPRHARGMGLSLSCECVPKQSLGTRTRVAFSSSRVRRRYMTIPGGPAPYLDTGAAGRDPESRLHPLDSGLRRNDGLLSSRYDRRPAEVIEERLRSERRPHPHLATFTIKEALISRAQRHCLDQGVVLIHRHRAVSLGTSPELIPIGEWDRRVAVRGPRQRTNPQRRHPHRFRGGVIDDRDRAGIRHRSILYF